MSPHISPDGSLGPTGSAYTYALLGQKDSVRCAACPLTPDPPLGPLPWTRAFREGLHLTSWAEVLEHVRIHEEEFGHIPDVIFHRNDPPNDRRTYEGTIFPDEVQ